MVGAFHETSEFFDGNLTSLYEYASTKLNSFDSVLMNLPSDALGYVPWLYPYENSKQGDRPTGFSQWVDQQLEELWDCVQGVFAWIGQSFSDVIEMVKEAALQCMMDFFPEWLLYLMWLAIRSALLIMIWIEISFSIAFFTLLFLSIYAIIDLNPNPYICIYAGEVKVK